MYTVVSDKIFLGKECGTFRFRLAQGAKMIFKDKCQRKNRSQKMKEILVLPTKEINVKKNVYSQ